MLRRSVWSAPSSVAAAVAASRSPLTSVATVASSSTTVTTVSAPRLVTQGSWLVSSLAVAAAVSVSVAWSEAEFRGPRTKDNKEFVYELPEDRHDSHFNPGFVTPPLPYEVSALEPHVPAAAIESRFKVHKALVSQVNHLSSKTAWYGRPLEEIVYVAPRGDLFNTAVQAWNMYFTWHSMSPSGGSAPTGEIASRIQESFGSFDAFKSAVAEKVSNCFGSGYVWLVQKANGTVRLVVTTESDCPLRNGSGVPILAIDAKSYVEGVSAEKHLEGFWNVVNWSQANKNLIKDLAPLNIVH